MAQRYPEFRSSYMQEELIEHILLTPAELALVLFCRGDDRRALTPLFHGHIDPYGQFELNLTRSSFLEAA